MRIVIPIEPLEDSEEIEERDIAVFTRYLDDFLNTVDMGFHIGAVEVEEGE